MKMAPIQNLYWVHIIRFVWSRAAVQLFCDAREMSCIILLSELHGDNLKSKNMRIMSLPHFFFFFF